MKVMPPAKSFDHFILTRYNIGLYRDDSRVGDKDGWLRDRNRLFKTYCRPSVLAQTDGRFQWIIAVDPKTPDTSFLDGLNCNVVTATYWDTALSEFQRVVRSLSNSEWVVTSRLDNDDALSRHYIASVASHFSPDHRLFINFGNAYRFCDKRHTLTLRTGIRQSNTALLVENRNDVKTVFQTAQGSFSTVGTVINIDDAPPMSLVVMHGRNLANRRLYMDFVDKRQFDEALDHFPLLNALK